MNLFTEIVHCVLYLHEGYVLGVSSGLVTDRGGSDPGVMSGGFMSANPLVHTVSFEVAVLTGTLIPNI